MQRNPPVLELPLRPQRLNTAHAVPWDEFTLENLPAAYQDILQEALPRQGLTRARRSTPTKDLKPDGISSDATDESDLKEKIIE